MLKIILISVAALIVLFIVVVSLRPSKFRVERSTAIAAPAADVFAQVNDLHRFQDWSPWAKMDPQCKITFDGPSAGTGASFTWAGNNKVGEGRMTVTDSRPAELVRFKLEFFKPFKAVNTAEFTFKPDGDQTVVTWSMFGDNNFIGKAIGLFMDCDKMVGPEFEKGLATLKSIAESTAKK